MVSGESSPHRATPNPPPTHPKWWVAHPQHPCLHQQRPNATLGQWFPTPLHWSKPTSDCVERCRWLGTHVLATNLQPRERPDSQVLSQATRHLSWEPRVSHCWGGQGTLRPKMRQRVSMKSSSATSWPGVSALVLGSTPHQLGNPTTRTGEQPLSRHHHVRHGGWLGWVQLQQMVDAFEHQPAQFWEASHFSLC